MKATPAQLRAFSKDPTFRALIRAFSVRKRVRVDEFEFGDEVTVRPRVAGIEFADGAVFREKPAEFREKTREDLLIAEATWLGSGPMPKALRSDDYDKRTGTWRKVGKKKKKRA